MNNSAAEISAMSSITLELFALILSFGSLFTCIKSARCFTEFQDTINTLTLGLLMENFNETVSRDGDIMAMNYRKKIKRKKQMTAERNSFSSITTNDLEKINEPFL